MLLTKVEEMLGFKDGLFTDLFWTSGLSAEKVLARRNGMDLDRAVASLATENDQQPDINCSLGYRLGEDGTFRTYQNQYTVNDYAKTPLMRVKERDRKKYLCNRFSLADEGAFQWSIPKGKYLYGSESDAVNIIQYTLYNFAQRIPPVLMHRLWKRDGLDSFTKGALAPTSSVEELRDLLLRFECGVRKPVMASVFWGTLGHTRLIRLTAEDREAKQMVDAKKKKMDRELVVADADDEDSDVIWVKYTKLGGAPKHNIWRLKDEQYRVNGRGSLSGWLWTSKLLHRDIRQLPEKPPLGIDGNSSPEQLQTTSAKKAFRLARVADKLLQWRFAEHEKSVREIENSIRSKCYSSECRGIFVPSCDDGSFVEPCYSYECRQEQAECYSKLTSGCVHAQNPSLVYTREKVDDKCCQGVLGEDKPFPLPVPFNFSAKRSGEKSLLILPQKFLRRLARQGGLRPDFFPPGFHRIAKSNTHVWNYPCQRPLFDHCWRYLTLRARSYHAVALQLRILYACIRWGDMERDEDEEERVTIHHPDHDEVRVVIGHKEFPPDGLYERYKLKVQLIPLEDPNDVLDETGEDEEGYRPGRSLDVTRSARKRRVVTKVRDAGHNGIRNTSKMKVVEKWIDGVELKLWEIIAYWKNHQACCSPNQRMKGINVQTHIIGSRQLPKRRPHPRRLTDYDYDYDFDDDEVDLRKQIKHERAPAILRSREGFNRKDLGEAQQFLEHSSAQSYDKLYAAQRPHICRRLSSYGSGNPELYVSESPFNPRFRMRCRVMTAEDAETNEIAGREAGCLRGGGKGLPTSEDLEQPAASVSPPSTSEDPVQSGSRSPIDEPPLIPRYDNSSCDEAVNGTRDHSEVRTVPYQQRRIIYSSPSTSGTSLRPLASKVLMIRRADGTTQFLRPIAQSSSKDDRGQTHTVITTAQVGGSTMSEARGGMGLSSAGQRVFSGSGVFTARQFSNRSLIDHAGMVQQRRIVPTIRGQSPYGHAQTRIVRIAPTSGCQASSSPNIYSTGSQVRVQQSSLGNGMIIAEKDSFVKRIGMDKSLNNSQVIYTGSSNSNIRRRPNGRDTYAGYYGEKSNDRIDVEEYQMLAERGYRPPGRPPGRLASTFGYGPRANQRRAILLSRGGHGSNGGISTSYSTDGTIMMPSTTRYDNSSTRMVHSPNRGITTIGTFSGGQYRMRNISTYKEYCLRKGIEWSGDRFRCDFVLKMMLVELLLAFRRQLTRPVRFEFESNEEEERAIAEAIAKEEELMRLEEERKKLAIGISVDHDSARYGDDIRRKDSIEYREIDALRVSSAGNRRLEENLTIRECDSVDTVQIKQVLNELVMQVCRWDKDYNWHKTLLRKAKEQNDADRFYRSHRTLKSRQKQLEIDLNERMDRIRREINKRRMKLESKVEMEMGMAVPWRRPRGRPNKAVRQQYMAASSQNHFNANLHPEPASANPQLKKELKTEVEEIPTLLDPAAISLSDTFCVQSIGVKSENDKPEPTYSDLKDDCDLQFSVDRLKDKTKDKKKTECGKKSSSFSQNLSSFQRGRGRPRKDVDEMLLKPCSSSSNSQIVKLDGSLPALQPSDTSSAICICNKVVDPKAFCINCNTCHRYFHGKCMNISEKKWSKMKQWTCQECMQLNAKDEALYCICRTPYDDSQFYVGCDRCEGWYHLQCVGITQAEAEAMKEYICPNCKNNEQVCTDSNNTLSNVTISGPSSSSLPIVLTRKDYDLIGQLLSMLTEQQASWPFKEKTDEKVFPDYYETIKNPIDLSVIGNKIERLQYQRLDEFLADIKQMFENARLYHPKASAIFRCANTLERLFDSYFAKVKKQIELRNRERLRVSESRTADSLDISTDELFQMGSDFDASILDDII
uniref:SMB domain-containing protein n=1 Tax=Syphacia muris TaxID=451379 RepID=A0A158R694_9BILA